jgi:hypothetical protein
LTDQTDRITDVVDSILRKVEQNKDRLGVEYIFYRDQEKIPSFPAICVEPGPLTKTLTGVGGKGRTDNNFTVFLIVYIGHIGAQEEASKESDKLAELLMDIIHEDMTLGGLVAHGFVAEITPGYSFREKATIKAARLTWRGLSKTLMK